MKKIILTLVVALLAMANSFAQAPAGSQQDIDNGSITYTIAYPDLNIVSLFPGADPRLLGPLTVLHGNQTFQYVAGAWPWAMFKVTGANGASVKATFTAVSNPADGLNATVTPWCFEYTEGVVPIPWFGIDKNTPIDAVDVLMGGSGAEEGTAYVGGGIYKIKLNNQLPTQAAHIITMTCSVAYVTM